jgi:hypothetical protein
MGEEFVKNKYREKKVKEEQRGENKTNIEPDEDYGSRFVISPNNYWNM